MSKFGESLAFIKSMSRESIYHTNNEESFNKKYLEAVSSVRHTIDQQKIAEWQKNAHHKSQFLKYSLGNYYENLYASFLFIYEIELILDEIEYDGMSFNRANALLNMCSLLSDTSTKREILNQMQVEDCPPLVIGKCDKRKETELKLSFCKYINERFPDDEELILCTKMDGGLCDFFSKCLDRIDQLEL